MENFPVLVIGSGGREHALVLKLAESSSVSHVYVCPGNGSTSKKCTNIDLPVGDFGKLIEFCRARQVGLVVVGPEQPLVDGISDAFKQAGIPCFGPCKSAARLEGSKAFSKDFMTRHSIPTAAYKSFTDFQEAKTYVEKVTHRIVVKASGLAAGKGVILPATTEEAVEAVKSIMLDKAFGEAGSECVIEECLEGEECSILAFTDGFSFVTLPAAQDHKRALDGDLGPNTGGMGAYAPAPVVTPSLLKLIEKQVLKPTIDGIRKEGSRFVGILYAGIMLTASGPKVLEYNCRFGDPETQVLIPLLSDDTDLAQVMLACVDGCLDSVRVGIRAGHAVTVVAAACGYPASYKKGDLITLGSDLETTTVYQAGTKINGNGQLVTSGGRVLAVTAVSTDLQDALSKAYARLSTVSFEGMQYRKDIGHRAIACLSKNSASTSYADAGVSIDQGNLLVEKIKSVVKNTQRPGTDAVIGGFGGLFDLKAAGYTDDPILVSATDGVGTKLKIAQIMNKHDTIGIDLVAMNVNDLVVQGAEPLFFLDYFACGKLEVEVTKDVVCGIAAGCLDANCALVGGETAEMPGLYGPGDYDLAGFTVGAVNRPMILPLMDKITPGDVLLGLPSSGIHSNGYSLVRHLISKHGVDYHAPAPFDPFHKLGDVLLTPTKIYVRGLLPVVRTGRVKALAHITGGGFIDNIPRVLPDNIGVVMDASSWPLPPVFKWLKKLGNLSSFELSRTFNCGVGMVLVVAKEDADAVTMHLNQSGESTVYNLGKLVDLGEIKGEHSVQLVNTETAW